ncbi:cytochrome P450 4C1-like [Ooceraea biroi]|uniref:cytochrome P450 4C1-like n=1 Tax=Ooceraea biroi TaxID=2015173 RepID=UPI000F0950EA|nr:cytochrome P450 4C1-like [Ooceraea biroi]
MDIIFLILCTLCIVIFKILRIMYRQYIIWSKVRHLPQNVYPFISRSLALLKMSDQERIEWNLSLIDRFKEGICLEWIAGMPIIFVFKPEFIQPILTSTVNLDKGIGYTFTKPVLGEGLITSAGTQWLHDRKLITPTFHISILNKYAITISEKTKILIKCLEREIERNSGNAIDIVPFIAKVTLDITCDTAMGMDLRFQEVENEFESAMHRGLQLLFERLFQPWFWIDWLYYLTSSGREYKSLINIFHKFSNEIILKKKALRQSQSNHISINNEDEFHIAARKKKAFLDLLLDENEKTDNPLSDDQLQAQVHTFLLASQDTTAAAIIWTLFLLGNNLEHQEKLHEELEKHFQDSETLADGTKLSQLKYLDRVIKETLRLYPSVPVISRTLTENVKIGDYMLPQNIEVVLSLIVIHRNPEFWPDPTKFDPDRFLPENTKARNQYAYIPFSAGPRNCIGQKFALLVIKTLLTAILRKWRVKSVKTPDMIHPHISFTYRPGEEVFLYFIPKK